MARAMANMGLEGLVIVDPGAPIGGTAQAFAVGAHGILDRHRRVGSLGEALAPYRRVVGTTSSRDRRIGPAVPLLHPRELPAFLADDPPGTPTALVFGPEPSGLTAEELAPLSPLVRIPCAPEQPTLNLAQAVLILAWELFEDRRRRGRAAEAPAGEATDTEPVASAAAVAGLLEHARRVLEGVGFARDDTFEAVMLDLRRLAARSEITEREVTILRGICRRTQNTLDRHD